MPEPVEADGTSEGNFEGNNPTPEVQSWLDSALAVIEQLITWWEILWPRLHLSFSFNTSGGGFAIVHISIDILGELRAEETDFDSPIFDLLDENGIDMWAQQVSWDLSKPGPAEDGYRSGTNVALGIIHHALALLAGAFILGGLPLVAGFMAVAVTAWTVWLSALFIGLGLEIISLNFVFGIIGAWGIKFLNGDGGYLVDTLIKSTLWAIACAYVNKAASKWINLATWLIFTILGIVVEMCMFVYTYYLFCTLWEYSILNFVDGVSN